MCGPAFSYGIVRIADGAVGGCWDLGITQTVQCRMCSFAFLVFAFVQADILFSSTLQYVGLKTFKLVVEPFHGSAALVRSPPETALTAPDSSPIAFSQPARCPRLLKVHITHLAKSVVPARDVTCVSKSTSGLGRQLCTLGVGGRV